ncbi:SPOR domain-containing protein [Hyphomicrobium sp. CS1GBMeth3]|uniref:SPOR domain-containing protein n=1 Tax=Hyphomicrobium sp. CS1GBMeth3 TaxID=1892845 RepID=UPI000931AC5B|nr:SPOR domain-containing protein [Hyphomicrobium sp. CS1GBMeth3]
MTRYSNPLPHNQIPNTQGRPAGAQPQAPHASHYEQPGWPQPAQPASPHRNARPAAPAYGDAGAYGADLQSGGRAAGGSQSHDPYAALRPDGYGYSQPQQPASDPYGLAGYTAPQPAPSYASRAPQAPAAPQPSYGTPADPYAPSLNGYGQGQASSPAPSANGYGHASGASSAYAQPQTRGYEPSFGGTSAPAPSPQLSYGNEYASAPGGQHGAAGDQWGSPSLGGLDTHDYGQGYGAQDQWGADPYGDPQLDPQLGPAPGYENGQQHATFDQSYADDEAQYEDEPRRGGWKKVVGLVACTVLLGGAGTIAYNSILGPSGSDTTPLVKSASGPSKVKPSEPGGKQFAHTDSKIMGRLGDGGSEPNSDPAGVRRVPVMTVGRDGSIQAPPTEPEQQTAGAVSVPGLTVIDGFGSGPSPTRSAGPGQASPPVQMAARADSSGPVTVSPPAKKMVDTAPAETGAVEARAPAAAAPKADPPPKKKVAAATPASTGPRPTGAGYVAVLASVPASDSSRIDALKQFADMQQRYSSILVNKTPDVQEANLGEKGTYHRLLVGPPGSRDSASSLCSQLKAEGYSGCWVTAY